MSLPSYQLLAKQAIYNDRKDCIGHELLFRSPLNITAIDVGADLATQQVLVNYCSSISESLESGVGPVFLNVDAEFLLKHETIPVDPAKVYLEINSFKALTEELEGALRAWGDKGFKLGLAGFNFSNEHISALAYFVFVKVDMLNEPARMLEHKAGLSHSKDQLWIAERIEDESVFEACRNAGFDFFQGYFLARPKEVMGSSIRPGTAVTIKIVKELDQPDISMDKLAELVSQDPKLAVQMLKIINSSLFALPKQIDDLKDALVFLGIDMLRHWAMILAFVSNGSVHIEASRIILNRAKTCELLCRMDGTDPKIASSAFLSGLVSGVDVLVHVSPAQFLAQVELSETVEQAVLNREGHIGHRLGQVLDLEQTISNKHFQLAELDENLIEAYRSADAWVDQVVNVLKA